MLLCKNYFNMFSVIISFVMALFVKAYRQSPAVVDNQLLSVLLGSLPSFLYVFGLICMIPIVKAELKAETFFKSACFLTVGALSYEIDQLFSSRIFDYYDIAATLLAFVASFVVYKVNFSRNIPAD